MQESPCRRRTFHRRFLLLSLACLLCALPAGADLLRPWEGTGDFKVVMDYANRPAADGTVDVVCYFSVPNGDIGFEPDDIGRLRGELSVMLQLTGEGGAVTGLERKVPVHTFTSLEAGSPTTYQIFNLTLTGVEDAAGELVCVVEDMNRLRKGLYNIVERKPARSELSGRWLREDLSGRDGMVMGFPVFLAGAPVGFWSPGEHVDDTVLADHLHPNRRYGIENETLQIYFEIDPRLPAGGGREPLTGRLLMQILAKDLDFAMRDTIPFSLDPMSVVRQGGTAGVFYELDVNRLPPGVYQLSCAPLDGPGVPWVAEFDVFWSATALNRDADELRGEGLTVLMGDELDAFLEAGQAEREAMLADFWAELDPDPETPYNEGRMEFRRRMAYVNIYLGGFGKRGAKDDRGLTYLLLGPPDAVHFQIIPTDQQEMDDAMMRVFDGFAPQRDGSWARSDNAIVMPSTYQSRRELAVRRTGTARDSAFELWTYRNRGNQLFPNLYSERTLGLRFLFTDRQGRGHYRLEVSNAFEQGGAQSVSHPGED